MSSVLVTSPLGNPFPTVNSVMDTARARANDMMNDSSGDLLTNDAPFSQTFLDTAWDWYQEQCAHAGVATLKKTIVLYGIPPRFTQDTANECYVSWTGCSDGVNQYDSPAFPQDLINPLKIERRQSGTNNEFILMHPAEDGLPRFLSAGVHDWREDGLYHYGDTYSQDFKVSYAAYLPALDLTRPSDPVPMMRCKNPLGARVAFEFANARVPGGAGAVSLDALSNKEFSDGVASRTGKLAQRKTARRRPYRGGCSYNRFPYQVI